MILIFIEPGLMEETIVIKYNECSGTKYKSIKQRLVGDI